MLSGVTSSHGTGGGGSNFSDVVGVYEGSGSRVKRQVRKDIVRNHPLIIRVRESGEVCVIVDVCNVVFDVLTRNSCTDGTFSRNANVNPKKRLGNMARISRVEKESAIPRT